MATVSGAIAHVNDNLQQLLPSPIIIGIAQDLGHHWRQRKLGPATTITLLLMQLLHGNASLAQARAIAGRSLSISALAKARQRLPLELLHQLGQWLIEQFICSVVAADVSPAPRVLLVDAGNYYTPDTRPLRRHYRHPRQQRSRCDYPQLRALCVFDLATGLMLQQHDFPSDCHESPQLRRCLDHLKLRRGDIILFDRGFVSYTNIALLLQRGVHVVARLGKTLQARRRSRRTRIARLGNNDALVRWQKPPAARGRRTATQPRPLWRGLPEQLKLRQLTVPASATKGSRARRITLITTLLQPKTHPARQLAQWYGRRWEIEINLRHLKSTLKLEFLRSKSVDNVRRELVLRMMAYNLVRIVMLKAAHARRCEPTRISFADAVRLLLLAGIDRPWLLTVLLNVRRQRRGRVRKLKYRGKNYRLLSHRPACQTRVA